MGEYDSLPWTSRMGGVLQGSHFIRIRNLDKYDYFHLVVLKARDHIASASIQFQQDLPPTVTTNNGKLRALDKSGCWALSSESRRLQWILESPKTSLSFAFDMTSKKFRFPQEMWEFPDDTRVKHCSFWSRALPSVP